MAFLLTVNKGEKMNDDIKKKMKEMKDAQENSVKYLIGRRVNMIITEEEYQIDKDEKIVYKEYEINDPEFKKEIDSINDNNRIFTPGTAGTMDYKMGRLNIYINEEGIVNKVNFG